MDRQRRPRVLVLTRPLARPQTATAAALASGAALFFVRSPALGLVLAVLALVESVRG